MENLAMNRRADLAAARGTGLRLEMDPLRVLIALLMIVSISRVQQAIPLIGVLRPGALVVLLSVGYAALNPGKLARGRIWQPGPARTMVLLGLMACASVPLAISLGASGAFILRDFSKVLVGAFLVVLTVRNVRDLYTYCWAYVVSVGALAFIAIFVIRMAATSDGLLRLADDFSYDANDIGTIMVVGLAVTLLMFQSSRRLGKIVAGMVMLMIGAALAKTGSRGAFLGLVAVGGLVLVMLNRISVAKRVGFVVAVVLALAFAAPAGYWDQMQTILHPSQDYNMTAPSGRVAVLKRGIGYMMRNPITGIGVGNFMRAEGMLSERAQRRLPGMAGIKWSAAHNSFLQAAAEMGIPGLLLFGALIFGTALRLRRLHRRMPPAWEDADPEHRFVFLATQYLPVAFLGFAISGFFVSFAYYDVVYILAAVAAGTLAVGEAVVRSSASGAVPVAAASPRRAAVRGARSPVPLAPTPESVPVPSRRVPGFVPHRMRR